MHGRAGRIELKAADIGPRYSGQAVKVASGSPSAVRLLVPDAITVAATVAAAALSGQRSPEAFLHYLELLPRAGSGGSEARRPRQQNQTVGEWRGGRPGVVTAPSLFARQED